MKELDRIVSTFQRTCITRDIRRGTFLFEKTGTEVEHDQFNGHSYTYHLLVCVNKQMSVIDIENLLRKAFARILEVVRQRDGYIVKLYFDKFPECPFSMATLNVCNLTVDMFWNALAHHMQSNKFITINELCVTDVCISKIEGDGKKNIKNKRKLKKFIEIWEKEWMNTVVMMKIVS